MAITAMEMAAAMETVGVTGTAAAMAILARAKAKLGETLKAQRVRVRKARPVLPDYLFAIATGSAKSCAMADIS
ncbi:hypothetical protein ASD32_28270 [Rhizobium sp. Root483D2]|nr:hypothetical protein ASD32_28270 [Rhizobium sp. Root483D2]